MLGEHLERAAAALASGDRVAALDALIAAWRECRAPELEALIGVVSVDVSRSIPPLDDADPAAYDVAWTELESRQQAVDIGRLIDGLWSNPKGSIPLRVRALLGRGPDPRVGAGFVKMIACPPTTASSNFSTWTRIFDALPDYADAGVTEMLEARAATHDGKSQFWPKLTGWIEEVVDKLPAAATLPKGSKKKVASLLKSAKKLARGRAAELSFVRSAQLSDIDPRRALDIALDKINADDLEGAIEALCAFWAERRSIPVAELVDELGALIDEHRPRLDSGTGAEIHRRWMERGENPTPAEVGAHLAALENGTLSDIEERLAAMVRWAPDPRVSGVAFRFISNAMIGARPLLWRAVYDVLLQHADSRLEDRFVARSEQLDGAVAERRQIERRSLRRVEERVMAAFEAVTPLAKSEKKTVVAIATKLEALLDEHRADQAGEEQMIASFIDSIAAAPDDDGPRLVFSDWLLERGDPIGQFISLSVALAAGKKVKGKLQKLERKHRAAIRGPLAPILYDCEYQRGFLHKAWIETHRGALERPEDEIEEMLSDWRWSTLETLRTWNSDPGLERVLREAPLRMLRRLERVSVASLTHLPRELPIESVELCIGGEYDGVDWEAVEEVVKRLPKLTALESIMAGAPPLELLQSSLASQLERIVVGSPRSGGFAPYDEWIERLYQADCRVPIVELTTCDVRATIRATPKRKRLALSFTFEDIDEYEPEPLLEALRAIPRRAISETTCSYKLPSRDKRRRRVREALAHLEPKTVRYRPPPA